jgi:iron complex outermembrane receptor protein
MLPNRLRRGLARVGLGLFVSSLAAGEALAAGSIQGKVLAPDGSPAAGVRVRLVNLNRQADTAAGGTFRFDGVPAGEALLEARSARYGQATRKVVVPKGGVAEAELELDVSMHQEIVVTAGPDERQAVEVAQPVSVLSGTQLSERLQPTLGETLAREPGVSSTYFGPGASRPVIRGLGGDRIRVLENGIGVGDASSTSPDHAVSADPMSAQTIEVLRGPATLLYGSSAIGGVVNLLDQRIPDTLPARAVEGSFAVQGGTVAEELSGSLSAQGRLNGRVAWHLDALKRRTEDYKIPGLAAVEEEHAGEAEAEHEEQGVLENSAIDSEGLGLGLSYVVEAGFLGVAASGFNTDYGIPGGHHHEEEAAKPGGSLQEEAEAGVTIGLQQRRLDVQAGLTRPFSGFRGLKLRFGATDYEHTEFEGEEVGTVFRNNAWEGRLELPHRRLGPIRGSIGVQVSSRDFEAIGEEAFVPPTDTTSVAVFAFEEFGSGRLRPQLGLRFESQDTSAQAGPDRSFQGLSGSAGLLWLPDEDWSFGLSVARAVKLPNAEELYSNGPHIATNQFEIGDPDLDEETSLGLDLSLRRRTGRLTGEINVFVNRFDKFIFEERTGEEEDGLPVFRYVQRDAQFWGGELHADLELLHTDPHHVELELLADFVRAELRDTDEPLPRIVPPRLGAAVVYQGSPWSARVEVRRVQKQDRVAELETETPGYTMLDASVGYRFFAGRTIHDVALRGTNLADEEARNHVSFLKDLAPLPGRNISLSYTILF